LSPARVLKITSFSLPPPLPLRWPWLGRISFVSHTEMSNGIVSSKSSESEFPSSSSPALAASFAVAAGAAAGAPVEDCGLYGRGVGRLDVLASARTAGAAAPFPLGAAAAVLMLLLLLLLLLRGATAGAGAAAGGFAFAFSFAAAGFAPCRSTSAIGRVSTSVSSSPLVPLPWLLIVVSELLLLLRRLSSISSSTSLTPCWFDDEEEEDAAVRLLRQTFGSKFFSWLSTYFSFKLLGGATSTTASASAFAGTGTASTAAGATSPLVPLPPRADDAFLRLPAINVDMWAACFAIADAFRDVTPAGGLYEAASVGRDASIFCVSPSSDPSSDSSSLLFPATTR
jgi:hypothetical protein